MECTGEEGRLNLGGHKEEETGVSKLATEKRRRTKGKVLLNLYE